MPKWPPASGPPRKVFGVCIAALMQGEDAPRRHEGHEGKNGLRSLRVGVVNYRERATWRNSRILSGSLSPGRRSTPDETSTAVAPEIRTASGKSSAVSPPDSIHGRCH